MRLLAQQQLVDPVALLLIVAALGCLLIYLLVDEFVRGERDARHRLKLVLICLIIAFTVFLPSLKLVAAAPGERAGQLQPRRRRDPDRSHDRLLADAGGTPTSRTTCKTPMAEWGINEFRTALYHYPYLPWTFLFSAPFKLLVAGAARLVRPALRLPAAVRADPGACCRGWRATRERTLLLVMLIGLNPIMGSDLIYGQNDSFVLAWIVLSLWLWERGRGARQTGVADRVGGGLRPGLRQQADRMVPGAVLPAVDCRAGRSAAVALRARGLAAGRAARLAGARRGASLVVGPYFVWNPAAMFDDVWKWSAGTSATALSDLGLGRIESGAGAGVGQEPLRRTGRSGCRSCWSACR